MKIESAAFELSAGLVHQLPASNLPEVAFSGRSNVGKSSLINRLLNRKAAGQNQRHTGEDRHHQLLPAGYPAPGGSAGIRLRQGFPTPKNGDGKA